MAGKLKLEGRGANFACSLLFLTGFASLFSFIDNDKMIGGLP